MNGLDVDQEEKQDKGHPNCIGKEAATLFLVACWVDGELGDFRENRVTVQYER